jgi:hypothetical protein
LAHAGTKLVVHLRNGKLIKGTTLHIDPDEMGFYMTAIRKYHDPVRTWVEFADVKSVYRVKDFDGHFSPSENVREYVPKHNEVKVTYYDGEKLEGYVIGQYDPTHPRFWLIPARPDTNNISVLVERAALTSIELGQTRRRAHFRSLVDNALKRRMLSYYWRNPRASVDSRQLAIAVEADAAAVERAARAFEEFQLFHKTASTSGGAFYRFHSPRERALREFIVENARA